MGVGRDIDEHDTRVAAQQWTGQGGLICHHQQGFGGHYAGQSFGQRLIMGQQYQLFGKTDPTCERHGAGKRLRSGLFLR